MLEDPVERPLIEHAIERRVHNLILVTARIDAVRHHRRSRRPTTRPKNHVRPNTIVADRRDRNPAVARDAIVQYSGAAHDETIVTLRAGVGDGAAAIVRCDTDGSKKSTG